MNKPLRSIAIAQLLFAAATCFSQSSTPDQVAASTGANIAAPRYKLRDRASTGSNIPEARASTNRFPLDRPYEKFTPEEKAKLRAEYVDMPEDDEPPFPAKGFRPILDNLAEVITGLRIEGKVWILITIDDKGEAVSFDLIEYSDLDVAKAVAYVFSQANYKPGVCGGKPCTMQLAFRADLRSRP